MERLDAIDAASKLDLAKLRVVMARKCMRVASRFHADGEIRVSKMWEFCASQVEEHGNFRMLQQLQFLNKMPVPIAEFLDSTEFIGSGTAGSLMDIWQRLRPLIEEVNPDVMIGEPYVDLVLMGGGTSTGKSATMKVTNGYQMYLLTCFDTPQRLYRIPPGDELVFSFQSTSIQTTKSVLYEPFRRMMLAMPYFRKNVAHDKDKDSSLALENNVVVKPHLATETAVVGQAIIGAALDEVNHMLRVEKSKKIAGPRGDGGDYDQAKETFDVILGRRGSRFTTAGISIGSIVAGSSTNYKDDFLDQKLDNLAEHPEEHVHTRTARYARYEINDTIDYSTATFPVLVASDRWATRILSQEEYDANNYPEGAEVKVIPMNFRGDFANNPDRALREVCGIASESLSPFITQRHKITEALDRYADADFPDWLESEFFDYDLTVAYPRWRDDLGDIITDKHLPRWVHCDLSATRDSCGITILKCIGFINIVDPDNPNMIKAKPMMVAECCVSLKPSQAAELDQDVLKSWILQLPGVHGIMLAEITFDGFESRKIMSELRKARINTRLISCDKTVEPYNDCRRALYEDRLALCPSETLRRELVGLEYDAKKDKVDHPPKGSKDISDSLAGAVHACETNRDIRSASGLYTPDGEKYGRERSRRQRPMGKTRKGAAPRKDRTERPMGSVQSW